MILSRKRPWEPEEEKQLREMAEAGKTITMIALRLKRTVTAVRGRLSILKVSLHKVRAEPKEKPAGVNRPRAAQQRPHQSSSGDGFRLSVNKTVRPVRRKCQSGWGLTDGGPAMTEYTVKEIGHQWVVYADRLSIVACADEASALKLIAEDSAANDTTRKSTVHGIRASKQNPTA